MRSLAIALAATFIFTACSSQSTTPTASTSAAPVAKAAVKAPQCYDGDAGKFTEVGTSANISGVMVKCELTADDKAAQWMGKKH